MPGSPAASAKSESRVQCIIMRAENCDFHLHGKCTVHQNMQGKIFTDHKQEGICYYCSCVAITVLNVLHKYLGVLFFLFLCCCVFKASDVEVTGFTVQMQMAHGFLWFCVFTFSSFSEAEMPAVDVDIHVGGREHWAWMRKKFVRMIKKLLCLWEER